MSENPLCVVGGAPALCVEARSPSDSNQDNAAYVEFRLNGLDVEISGGDDLEKLVDIGESLR